LSNVAKWGFNRNPRNGISACRTLKKTMTLVVVVKATIFFRDSDESGNEIVSVMFEMKNEKRDHCNEKEKRRFFG
jgi:hypothetical protein